jgi:hypothetical protein
MKLIDIKTKLPPLSEEVLVQVDGHRGPSWSNTYFLVAYLNSFDKKFYQHDDSKIPVVGVTHWAKLPKKILNHKGK